jgi:hypothetical protein
VNAESRQDLQREIDRRQADLAVRIVTHMCPDGSVKVPPRIARWLERQAGMTQERRLRLRDTDPEAYTVLAALHLAAVGGDLLAARSVNGTKDAGQQNDTQDSESEWLTASDAAEIASVTTRAITGWCRSGKLPADRHGRSWRINRRHLRIAQALAA